MRLNIDSAWWEHTLSVGLIAVLVAGLVLLAVLFFSPYALIHDYPEDIQKAAPQPTAAQKRVGNIAGAVFFVVLMLSMASAAWLWSAEHPDASFLDLALMTFAVAVMFALFDMFIIDWLVICTWRPQRLVFPGTEDCAGWRDYGFHVKEQLRPRGILALVIPSLLLGLIVFWLA